MKKNLFMLTVALVLVLTGCNTNDYSALETKISDLENDISELEELLSTVDDTDDYLTESDIADLQDTITLLQSQIDSLTTSNDENQTTINDLLLEIEGLEDELALVEDFNTQMAPVFENLPGNIVIEYQTDLDLTSLGLTAIDNIDGDVTSSIYVEAVDTSILPIGNYPITYSVTDSEGNTSSVTINLEVEFNNTKYTYMLINDRTEIKITGYKGYNSAFVTIPSSLGGLTVTEIEGDAFRDKGIISLTLPNTLEKIGKSAFIDNSIVEIDIPASVLSIGDFAFANNSLTYILIRNECEHVGENAFRNNNIESVTIGAYITDIGNGAFSENAITGVYIFGSESRFDTVWEDIGLPIELLGTQ